MTIMFRAVLFALLVASAASTTTMEDFNTFIKTYNKVYRDDEFMSRYLNYQESRRLISEHNIRYSLGQTSFYLAENQFADMSNEEFTSMLTTYSARKFPTDQALRPSFVHNPELPSEVDWRTKGYVTGVKNEGQCGACWAYSVTGSVEGAHFKATGKLVSLSEANLIDCTQKWGNHGCEGGTMENAFQYIIDNKGIDTEASYPFTGRAEKCRFSRATIGATISSYKEVQSGSEQALQEATATVGPISAAIDASKPSFRLYGGGIYDEPKCSSSVVDLAVLVVGYSSGPDAWIVKNSWGTTWGEKGYIRMSRNKGNQCGIATAASYPIV